MSNCQCGSKKKAIAPKEFSPNDTGGFCFLIGLDSFICPLIDKIPSLIGSPWKSILKAVAKESLSIAYNQLTGKFITASFCSTERPPLPPDITYQEVFLFLASYIPVVGGFANDDLLLNKITQIYLYQKWLDYCECKKCEPFTPENPFTNAPINSDCPPSLDRDRANLFISQNNAGNAGSAQSANSHNSASAAVDIDGLVSETITRVLNEGYYQNVFASEQYVPPEPEDTFQTGNYSFGCIDIAVRTRVYKIWTTRAVAVKAIDPTSFDEVNIAGFSKSAAKPYLIGLTPTYNRCDCFPPPTLPIIPKPTPPPEFCDRFPDDPFCLPTPSEECETESVIVSLFRECNLERYSVTRKLNVTGNDEAIPVQVFDACGTDRVQASKVLLKCEPEAIAGCTDPTANNYDPLAEVDDGSCVYGCSGFETEITAFGANRAEFGTRYVGYNRPYTQDELSYAFNDLMVHPIFLENFNTCDNELRQYFTNGWNQFFNPYSYGCTDSSALNYDPNAEEDDGSCIYYQPVYGCTDPSAINYDPNAEEDNGSCEYE